MGEYYPGNITIGGKLSEELLDEFVDAICSDGPGVGQEYEGNDYSPEEYRENLEQAAKLATRLYYSDPQARNGAFETIEEFCILHKLYFLRHSDAHHECDAELVWSTPDTVTSNGYEEVLLLADDVTKILDSRMNYMEQLAAIRELIKGVTPPEIPPFEIIKKTVKEVMRADTE